MTWTVLALAAAAVAALPFGVFLANLRLFTRAPRRGSSDDRLVSVLIPARDEEVVIGEAVASALASRGARLEVVVVDDGSTDRTAEIVEALAARDSRVRLVEAPPLEPGWIGKPHACAALAREARGDLLVFMDADLTLEPDALTRIAAFMDESGADLASGIARQRTVTFAERLVIPLIHFVLLGFLPIWRMRRSSHPAYASGSGQLVVARRGAYERAGGHAAIRSSRHDGVALARAFREAGLRTDLLDATDIATCRMYRSARQVWDGFVKNADEGLGAPRLILPVTALLGLGQVLPFALLAAAAALPAEATAIAAAAAVMALVPRLLAARRFRQPLDGALLHPLGVSVLLAIQWYALASSLAGRPATWKGRAYPTRPTPGAPRPSSLPQPRSAES